MLLQIDETTRIVSDELNFIVQKSYESKEGKHAGQVLWRSERYFPKLRQAVLSVLNSELMHSDATDLRGLLRDLETYTERLERAVREIGEVGK